MRRCEPIREGRNGAEVGEIECPERRRALSARTRSSAASLFSGFLHARTKSAPRKACIRAVSNPMPVLAPVTMAVRPAWSGMSLKVQALIKRLRVAR